MAGGLLRHVARRPVPAWLIPISAGYDRSRADGEGGGSVRPVPRGEGPGEVVHERRRQRVRVPVRGPSGPYSVLA